MSKKWFSDREFYGKLIKLTLPISFQSLMLASVAAGDAVMLGHIAQDSMAAVSLATQVQFLLQMIVSAAGKAEKAVKLILNVREDAGETADNAQAA